MFEKMVTKVIPITGKVCYLDFKEKSTGLTNTEPFSEKAEISAVKVVV